MKKLLLFAVTLFVLTIIGDRVSSFIYQYEANSFFYSLGLLKESWLVLLSINLALFVLDTVRTKFIGRIFDLNFSWQECFGGVCFNLLFGWLSPMAILGAPAMAWYYYKKGYPLVESVSVSFVRSFAIILTSAVTTIVIYSLNLQGSVANSILQEKVFQVLTGIAIYFFALIVLSYLPLAFIKRVNFLEKLTKQIRQLLEQGKLLLVPIFIITLFSNFLLVAYLVVKGMNAYQVPTELISQSMLFLSYMLLMPTPGASGLAEVGAPMIFSGQIPLNEMISMVSTMRFAIIGFQVIVGVFFMMFVFRTELSLEELQQFRKRIK